MIYLSAIQTSKVIQIFPDYFVAEIFPDYTKDRFICEVYKAKKQHETCNYINKNAEWAAFNDYVFLILKDEPVDAIRYTAEKNLCST